MTDVTRSLDANLANFLRQMPKAELHIHIEGSLEPELIFKLAERNGVKLRYPSVESLRAAYDFSNLQSFLDIYYAGASVLLTDRDFEDLAWAYFLRAKADGVVCAELFFDPQTHISRGVSMGTVISGLKRACLRAKGELGIQASLIMCFLRHLSEDDAFSTLAQAMPYLDDIIGVGLDSSEKEHPPEKFARVFARCRDLGLHLVAHAGEEGPPEYVWSALKTLGVERIDHGVQSTHSSDLMHYLVDHQVPLTVCPLSNVKLCVYDCLSNHPIADMIAKGVCVTINSDDPAYFGGYLLENYLQTFQAHRLGLDHAYQLARNSLTGSFATVADKNQWIHQLDALRDRYLGA